MNGIDLITGVIEDYEKQSGRISIVNDNLRGMINSIKMTLHDVRSTNSFMLMTINRCLDFTKVSKGMKLSPKYETIDLIETIAMPINCMKNIQSKVFIRLVDVANAICSHVITDKQWLQENILCLLSNAVKYSSEGEVTITISTETKIQDVVLSEVIGSNDDVDNSLTLEEDRSERSSRWDMASTSGF